MSSFNWLKKFHKESKKRPGYAQKTLDAYALGIKAGGSLVGVRIQTSSDSCEAARELDHQKIYLPKDAPLLPLPGCSLGDDCRCVYRPVMSYEVNRKEE
jgi:hypothetical protein